MAKENDELLDKIESIISSFDNLTGDEFKYLIDTLVFNRRIMVQDLKNRIVFNPDELEVIGDKGKEGQVWASIRYRNPGKRFKFTIYTTCEDNKGNNVGLIFSDPRIMYNELVNNVNGIEIQKETEVQIMSGPGAAPLTGKLFGIHYFDVSNSVYKQSDNTVHVVLKSPDDIEIVVILDSGETIDLKSYGYPEEDEGQ